MNFTKDEMMVMMLYSPGTRTGLIQELKKIHAMLGDDERDLAEIIENTLKKLNRMSDAEFDGIPLYPGLDL